MITQPGREAAFDHLPQWMGAARFSQDGQRLLTAGADGTARIWSIDSGEELVRLEGHPGSVERAVWSTDGTRVWALDLDELIAIARDRLTRTLSDAECAAYHFDVCPAT